MESVKELVGWIARTNWRKGGREDVSMMQQQRRAGGGECNGGGELAMGRSTTQLPSYHSNQVGGDRTQHSRTSRSEPQTPGTTTPTPALTTRNSWLDSKQSSSMNGTGSGSHAQSRAGSGGCKIVIWSDKDGFCARGNTVNGWVELNRAVSSLLFSRVHVVTWNADLERIAGPETPPPSTSTNLDPFRSLHLSRFLPPPDSLHRHGREGRSQEVYHWEEQFDREGNQVDKFSHHGECRDWRKVSCSPPSLAHYFVTPLADRSRWNSVKLDNCVVSNGVQIRDRAVLKDCEFGRDVVIDFDCESRLLRWIPAAPKPGTDPYTCFPSTQLN